MSKRIPYLVCALLLLAASGWSGWSEWSASSFIPFNGHFQNFWSLKRMSDGQTPFVDFPVYLGAGHLYAAWPLYSLLGGGFRAATAAHNALAGFCLAGSLLVTMRLLEWRWIPTFLSTAALWQVFYIMATAWSSVIGFRSALPAVIALVVYRWLPGRDTSPQRIAAYGLVMGATPLWSNDYGIPGMVSMLAVLLLAWPGIRTVAMTLLCALIGLGAGATAVSWGHPLAWLQSSIILPASVQAWYFNPIAENKIYSLLDFPWGDGAFILGCACLFVLLVGWPRVWNTKRRLGLPPRAHAAVTALILCALGGFTLSCLGGTYEQRYATPLWRYVLPMTVTLLLLLAALTPLGRLRQRYGLFTRYPILSGGLSAVLVAVSGGYAGQSYAPYLNIRAADSRGELRFAPSLNLRSWPEVAQADAIGRSLRAQGIGVGADYSSVVSIASHSSQEQPNYLIHAFGQEAQQRYRDMLDTGPQGRWETLDPDVLGWGLWLMRMSWPLHRDLLLNWQPAERTAWTILWKKREHPLEMHSASCEVVAGDGERPEVRVYSDTIKDAWWADVQMDVKTDFRRGWTPLAGATRLIDLVEGDDAPAGATPSAIVANRWTAPLQDGQLGAPVIVQARQGTTLRLRSWPAGRSSVRIQSCSARLVAPLSQTTRSRPSPGRTSLRTLEGIPSFDTDWNENGVQASRVFTANPYQALLLRRGDRVLLPDGRHGTVVLRDFGDFDYVPDQPGPRPEPGSEITVLPCPQEAPLGTMVLPLPPRGSQACAAD